MNKIARDVKYMLDAIEYEIGYREYLVEISGDHPDIDVKCEKLCIGDLKELMMKSFDNIDEVDKIIIKCSLSRVITSHHFTMEDYCIDQYDDEDYPFHDIIDPIIQDIKNMENIIDIIDKSSK